MTNAPCASTCCERVEHPRRDSSAFGDLIDKRAAVVIPPESVCGGVEDFGEAVCRSGAGHWLRDTARWGGRADGRGVWVT
jgi:hypothetical protein